MTDTMPAQVQRTIDPDTLMSFVFRAVDEVGATLNTATVVMGDKLGYYAVMADGRPVTPAELAEQTSTSEHYAREWLNNQAAGVALVGVGRGRQLGGRERPVDEGAVPAQPVAEHDERGVEGGADLVDGAEHEGHQSVAVDGLGDGWRGRVGAGLLGGGHGRSPLGRCRPGRTGAWTLGRSFN